MKHRYTLHPGREIQRDGKPFIVIRRAADTSPTEIDALARKMVAWLNAEKVSL